MITEKFYSDYLNLLFSLSPRVEKQRGRLDIKKLVSPHRLRIKKSVYKKIQTAIQSFYYLSRQPAYQQKISPDQNNIINSGINNNSVLMAYDFHVDPDTHQAFLIEVNTNASGFPYTSLLYQAQELAPPEGNQPLASLRQSFENEKRLFNNTSISHIAIIDEDVAQQKMYLEFLFYQDLFESWGIESNICDAESSDWVNSDFIYNRFCDFTLNEARSKNLLNAYLERQTCFSPQPREYILLADKQRLIDLSTPGWLEQVGLGEDKIHAIREVLIPTFDLRHFGDSEQLWSQRKSLFFKPKRAYGGKATYRGSSISRKMFDRLLNEDALVQNYVPAATVDLETQDKGRWKYDLRFFVYQDQIQLSCGRVYQGQVTNFNTEYGGFAALELV